MYNFITVWSFEFITNIEIRDVASHNEKMTKSLFVCGWYQMFQIISKSYFMDLKKSMKTKLLIKFERLQSL